MQQQILDEVKIDVCHANQRRIRLENEIARLENPLKLLKEDLKLTLEQIRHFQLVEKVAHSPDSIHVISVDDLAFVRRVLPDFHVQDKAITYGWPMWSDCAACGFFHLQEDDAKYENEFNRSGICFQMGVKREDMVNLSSAVDEDDNKLFSIITHLENWQEEEWTNPKLANLTEVICDVDGGGISLLITKKIAIVTSVNTWAKVTKLKPNFDPDKM